METNTHTEVNRNQRAQQGSRHPEEAEGKIWKFYNMHVVS